MGRKKLEMVLIKDKKTRARTFINRKNGILKKANELAKLCDVDVGLIIYKPNAGNPYVWPQESHKLNNILGRYRTTSIEDRQKRATNVCSIPKTDHIDSLSADQLLELIGHLDYKLGIVNERIDTVKRNEQRSIAMEDVQETMKMMNVLGMMPNNFQYMGDYQSNNHIYHQYVEDEKNADQISMPGSSRSTNFDNGYMGYNNGLMGVPNSFQYTGDYQTNDHTHHQYVEEQKNADRISMAGSSSTTNFGNEYMGYNNGIMGVHGSCENYNFGKNIMEDVNGDGGGMWNPTPLSWYCGPPQVNQY